MSNQRRPAPKASRANAPSGPRWMLPAGIAVVVVLIVGALVVTLVSGTGSSGNKNSDSDAKSKVEVADVVRVQGDALAPLPESGPDPAVGKAVPVTSGVTFDGSSVTVPGKGPSVVALVAHWCPHCRREVPVIMKIRQSGNWPSNVSLAGISTAVYRERGNYPPSAWLTSAGWDAPVLVDDEQATAAQAYGLTGFPFLVWSDANGKVVLRTSGEIPEAQLTNMLAQLGKGETPTFAGP